MKENLKRKRENLKKKEDDQHMEEEKEQTPVQQNEQSSSVRGSVSGEMGSAGAVSTASNIAAKDYLASGSRDKTIKIWEAKSGRCIITLIGHDNWITDVCFHPNGRYLLSVSDDKSMRLWDLSTGRCCKKLFNIHSHFVTSVAIKQKSVLTTSVDQTLKVWNCR